MGGTKSKSCGGPAGPGFPHQISHTDFHPVLRDICLKTWKNQVRVRAGFHPWITCKKTRLENMMVQPWSCQGRALMIYPETTKSGEEMVCMYHVAAGRSNTVVMPGCFNPQDVSTYFPLGIPILDDNIDFYFACLCVIGSRDETAVIQWITNDHIVHIAVVRLNNGVYRTVAVFFPEETEHALIYEATISCGQNQFLLRPNPVLCHRFLKDKYDSLPNNTVQVIDLELGTLKGQGQGQGQYRSNSWHYNEADNCYEEVESPVESFGKCLHRTDLFVDHADDSVIAYDPRFPSNRVAMGAMTGGAVEVYDIEREEYICESEDTHYILRLVYSPDGRHLAALTGSMELVTELVTIESVIVYNSDTLEMLQEVKTAPANCDTLAIELYRCHILPEFSSSGQYISVPKIKYSSPELQLEPDILLPNCMDIEMYTVPVEMSLQNLCRLCILCVVPVTRITLLPLPKPLQNYLLFRRNFTTL